MMRAIAIEIDEAPLSLAPPTEADYVGRMINAALHRPLVRRDGPRRVPGAAEAWRCSPDGLRWEFVLRQDGRWSDGAPLTAEDALAGLVAAAEHPLWSRYLRCLRAADASEPGRLCLTLRHPFHPLLDLLAVPDLAPRRPGRFSGPYTLTTASADEVALAPNPALAGADLRPPLRFVRNRDPERSPADFFSGRFDVTASTGFPGRHIRHYCKDMFYRTCDTGIVVQLEVNPRGSPWLQQRAARLALHAALDREAIAGGLHGAVRPVDGFGPACFASLSALALPAAELATAGLAGPPRLRLLFHDYEPNRAIAEAVAGQWAERLGLTTELVVGDFADGGCDDFDLLLALRFPTFPSPWAVLEHLALLVAGLADPAYPRLHAALAGWLRGPAAAALDLTDFGAGLREAMPVVPLFEVVGHWLQRPEAHGFDYPDDGYFDFEGRA